MWNEECGALITCVLLAFAVTTYGQHAPEQEDISKSHNNPELDSVIQNIFGINKQLRNESGTNLKNQTENNSRNISLKEILGSNWESENKPITEDNLEKAFKKSFTFNKKIVGHNDSSKFGANWDEKNKSINQQTIKVHTDFSDSNSKSEGNKNNNVDYDQFFRNIFGDVWDIENKPINEGNVPMGSNGDGILGLGMDDQSAQGLESKFGTNGPPNTSSIKRKVCSCKVHRRPICSWPLSSTNCVKPRFIYGSYRNYFKNYLFPVSFYKYAYGIRWFNNNRVSFDLNPKKTLVYKGCNPIYVPPPGMNLSGRLEPTPPLSSNSFQTRCWMFSNCS